MSYTLIPLDGERINALILDPVLTLAPLCDNVVAIEEIVSVLSEASLGFYEAIEAVSPWFSYLVRRDSDRAVVGTCSFKGAPSEGIVEVAYFTFPGYEAQGCATNMVAGLLLIARRSQDVSYVIAHTLPEENSSTSVLRRNGFEHLGTVVDPEDGDVWRWLLTV
ncbi:GNAT family N-acetyltransferase [Govanella unica]|uniref:GNAT family N-acetyltransferase n=1 Tax=Govanella unica TaxID=2975056 RepID=A0A9X3TYN2_9PROT|nr:GNAT family N-acetyltransferase [Govania unica]MDA5193807.1 GNAT family N-acetyltransferase [Govania unica]